jgi:hypothetical protein
MELMINLKCTKKLAKYLDIKLCTDSVPCDTVLGNWYANIIDSAVGDVFLFVNERSLLTVVVPACNVTQALVSFTQRVYQQLLMIGVSELSVKKELLSFSKIQLTKTNSRRILGTMNEMALMFRLYLHDVDYLDEARLAVIESKLNQVIYGPISYQKPVDVSLDLFLHPPHSEIYQ